MNILRAVIGLNEGGGPLHRVSSPNGITQCLSVPTTSCPSSVPGSLPDDAASWDLSCPTEPGDQGRAQESAGEQASQVIVNFNI